MGEIMGIEGTVNKSENGGKEIKAFSSDFKITQTNKKLDENFGIDMFEQDFLFYVYKKDIIREAIKFYDEFPTNYHKTEIAKDDEFERSRGLVATMEAIRTRGSEKTSEFMLGGGDILKEFKDKYEESMPKYRLRDDSESDLIFAIVHEYLVEKYIFGNAGVKAPDVSLPTRK